MFVGVRRSEEHTSELQSPCNLVCRLLLAKKNSPSLRRASDSNTRTQARPPQRRVSPTITSFRLTGNSEVVLGHGVGLSVVVFFFNDTATPEIYPLSLPDPLPLSRHGTAEPCRARRGDWSTHGASADPLTRDRKSTRLNSSHLVISYAVFCLK